MDLSFRHPFYDVEAYNQWSRAVLAPSGRRPVAPGAAVNPGDRAPGSDVYVPARPSGDAQRPQATARPKRGGSNDNAVEIKNSKDARAGRDILGPARDAPAKPRLPAAPRSAPPLELRGVRGGDPAGCQVGNAAVIAGRTRGDVNEVAARHGFHPEKGMSTAMAHKTSEGLKVRSIHHRKNVGWDELPVVPVKGESEETIHDGRGSGPTTRESQKYFLDREKGCIEIPPEGAQPRTISPSPRLRIVKPLHEDLGCGVSAIATIVGVEYDEARDAAKEFGKFLPDVGMTLGQIKRTLDGLRIKSTYHRCRPGGWDRLPDLALLAVEIKDDHHAVVFGRQDGKEYIYDCREDEPRRRQETSYVLSDRAGYIEIHSRDRIATSWLSGSSPRRYRSRMRPEISGRSAASFLRRVELMIRTPRAVRRGL